MKYYGLLVLGLWLIAGHLPELFNIHFSHEKIILTWLALIAGILLSVNELKAKLESIGTFALGIWLITGSLMSLFRFSFPSSQIIMAVLATVAGLLLIFKK